MLAKKRLNLFGKLNDNQYQYMGKYTEEERIQKYTTLQEKYMGSRVLIVVEKHKINELTNQQESYLLFGVERSKNLFSFIHIIRQNMHINPKQSLFIYSNNTLITSDRANNVGELYDRFKNAQDHHLYIKYTDIELFGA